MRSARQSMGLADPIWLTIQAEAREGVAHEPELASLLYAGVLHRSSLEEAVAARVAVGGEDLEAQHAGIVAAGSSPARAA